MAIVSYPVFSDRIGDILVTGEVFPFMDGHSQRRDPASGYPLWTVRASLLDVDLQDFAGEISLRLPSVEKPAVQPSEFVALEGVARVSSYQTGRGADARASVSLRGESFRVVDVSNTDSAGDHTRGLFVNWDGLPSCGSLVPVARPLIGPAARMVSAMCTRPAAPTRRTTVRASRATWSRCTARSRT
jgi:hypothetical protein